MCGSHYTFIGQHWPREKDQEKRRNYPTVILVWKWNRLCQEAYKLLLFGKWNSVTTASGQDGETGIRLSQHVKQLESCIKKKKKAIVFRHCSISSSGSWLLRKGKPRREPCNGPSTPSTPSKLKHSEEPKSPGVPPSWGNRSWSSPKRSWYSWNRMLGRRETHRNRALEIVSGIRFSLWLSTDLCRWVRKLPKARQRITSKSWQNNLASSDCGGSLLSSHQSEWKELSIWTQRRMLRRTSRNSHRPKAILGSP